MCIRDSSWAEDQDTLLSFAHEDYPTNQWGTAYTAPVLSLIHI